MKKKGNKSPSRHRWGYRMLFIIVIVILFVEGGYSLYKVKKLDLAVQKNSNKIEKIETIPQNGQQSVIDSDENILEYMKSEITEYREFIQNERDFLVTLVGMCAAALLALAGFIGLSTTKDIENKVEEIFEDRVKDIIEENVQSVVKEKAENITDDYIEKELFDSDRGKMKYLKDAINRQQKRKNRKILFLIQEGVNENILTSVQKLLREKELNISEISETYESLNSMSDKILIEYCKQYFIVVYQVNMEMEVDSRSGEAEVFYQRLANLSEENAINCILYSLSGSGRRLEELQPSIYVSLANTATSIIQQILTLLDC